jgi:hypothetical protein
VATDTPACAATSPIVTRPMEGDDNASKSLSITVD